MNSQTAAAEFQFPYLLFARLQGFPAPDAWIAHAQRCRPAAYPSTDYVLWLRAQQRAYRADRGMAEGAPIHDGDRFCNWLERRFIGQIAALRNTGEDWVSTWLPTGGAPLWAPSIYAGAR